MSSPDWLTVTRGDAPLIVSIPHAGTDIPDEFAGDFVSPEIARNDADWFVDRLYDFARVLGATVVSTAISRSVIDVNRDHSGATLYPGQATTGLCPETTFDGEPLYREGVALDVDARLGWFHPYHAALAAEIERLRAIHPAIILYEAHSIRSRVPRLFDSELPQFNIGTNDGESCEAELAQAVAAECGPSQITNGRFKGGWTTRHYGRPADGVHAIQMELAMRGYLDEAGWPPVYDEARAAPMRDTLRRILTACIDFAKGRA